MSRWARFFSRRKRMMEDLDQDIRDYIERETQDNIERGMPPGGSALCGSAQVWQRDADQGGNVGGVGFRLA